MPEPLRQEYISERPVAANREPNNLEAIAGRELIVIQYPARQAYQALRIGFTIAPLLAGIDKFFNLLTNWDQYLAPLVSNIVGVVPRTFMMGVGIIEIIAGIGVALKPKFFGFIVSLWLVGIIINLLIQGEYYDIALRDLGLAIAAFSLGRLAQFFDRKDARVLI